MHRELIFQIYIHPTNKNQLLQGNYYGICLLEKNNNGWQFKNKIQGFDYSSRYFALSEKNEIYISHEYKGVFRIKINNDYTRVTDFTAYKSPLKGKKCKFSPV